MDNSENSYIPKALVAVFLWSTAFASIKVGLKYLPPFMFAGLRFFFAGVILIPFAGKISNYLKEIKDNYKTILEVALFQTIILYSLFYNGLSFAPGSVGSIIVGSGPLFAAIMAHFAMNNDKMSLKKGLAFVFGVIGVSIIAFQKGGVANSNHYIIGVLLLVLSNISSAWGNVVVAKKGKGISAIALNSGQIMIGGLVLITISLIFEPSVSIPNAVEFYISLSWLTIVSAGAFSIWFKLLKSGVKISSLNLWKFLVPILGSILSWIIIPNDYPTLLSIVGMSFVAFAVLWYYKH